MKKCESPRVLNNNSIGTTFYLCVLGEKTRVDKR